MKMVQKSGKKNTVEMVLKPWILGYLLYINWCRISEPSTVVLICLKTRMKSVHLHLSTHYSDCRRRCCICCYIVFDCFYHRGCGCCQGFICAANVEGAWEDFARPKPRTAEILP